MVNVLAKWPIALRKMSQVNPSFNMFGKKESGMEIDGWVETFIVQPTKQNTHGQSMVKTGQRIVGNLNLVESVRKSYTGKKAFNEHTTKRHSIPSSLPDQLKGAWYCIKFGLFDWCQNDSRPKVITSGTSDK